MERATDRTRGLGTSVFSEFSALAAKHGAVNLGQGFPDFDGPEEVKAAAIRALHEGVNQYALPHGALALRQAIAAHSLRFHGMQVDPDTEVTVTSGATEALFDIILAHVNPGDEVILFEPFYDSYAAAVQMAGGAVRCVRLQPPDAGHPDWWFASGALAGAFNERTRLVVLNTPHNPTGKVFTRAELDQISALCVQHDVQLLSDEVYEHLVYPGAEHVRPATLPALRDRTWSVSSAGKTFSFTGWKVGWAIAPAALSQTLRRTHQFVTFATASPLQAAIAEALALPASYFRTLAQEYRERRDFLVSALNGLGLPTWTPAGSYFVISDLRGRGVNDRDFCRRLTQEVGVAALPVSPFYDPRAEAPPALVRFAFCKRQETLERAVERLRQRAL